MTREQAEKRGWKFELDETVGAVSHARKTGSELKRDLELELVEQVISTPSDDPLPTLLANIAEIEGEPFQAGYGIYEQPEQPAADVPVEERLAQAIEKLPRGKPVTPAALAKALRSVQSGS